MQSAINLGFRSGNHLPMRLVSLPARIYNALWRFNMVVNPVFQALTTFKLVPVHSISLNGYSLRPGHGMRKPRDCICTYCLSAATTT